MKASHTDQLELLELQKLDQKESALRHKRDSHPAHATVREFAGRVADLQRAAISQNAVIAPPRTTKPMYSGGAWSAR